MSRSCTPAFHISVLELVVLEKTAQERLHFHVSYTGVCAREITIHNQRLLMEQQPHISCATSLTRPSQLIDRSSKRGNEDDRAGETVGHGLFGPQSGKVVV